MGWRRLGVDGGVAAGSCPDDPAVGPAAAHAGPAAALAAGVRRGLCRRLALGRPDRGHRGPAGRRDGGALRRPGGRAGPPPGPLERDQGEPGHGVLAGRATGPSRPSPTSRSGRCTCRRPWTTAGCSTARSTPRAARWWPRRCAWPCRRGPTCREPGRPPGRRPGRHLPVLPRPPARPGPVAVTARMSTWWSSIEDLMAGRGGRVVDGPDSTGRRCRGCSATAPCTGWSCPGVRRCSTTAPPPAPSRPRCGTPWSSATSTAASRAATGRRCGARATTWSG